MSVESPYEEYRHSQLWRAVAGIIAELEASGEIKVETAPDYVIGFVCRELAAKGIVASTALSRNR